MQGPWPARDTHARRTDPPRAFSDDSTPKAAQNESGAPRDAASPEPWSRPYMVGRLPRIMPITADTTNRTIAT